MDTISGIPAKDVGSVVQDFIDNGVSRVVVERNEGGTYTITTAARPA